jgi:uncharacterized protein (DUF169 family)
MPVSITFVQETPSGIPHVSKREPASCAFWKLALTEGTFYATVEDHFGCPIGAHVQGLSLPDESARQLDEMQQMMLNLGYLTPTSLAQIPRLQKKWTAVVYAPLDKALLFPDVVLFLGNARQLMLLFEAAQLAGLPVLPLTGRPACSMIPTVLDGQGIVTNLGCIGNRVYTQILDDEFYAAIPGTYLAALERALPQIWQANCQLESYHCGRKSLVMV